MVDTCPKIEKTCTLLLFVHSCLFEAVLQSQWTWDAGSAHNEYLCTQTNGLRAISCNYVSFLTSPNSTRRSVILGKATLVVFFEKHNPCFLPNNSEIQGFLCSSLMSSQRVDNHSHTCFPKISCIKPVISVRNTIWVVPCETPSGSCPSTNLPNRQLNQVWALIL